MRGLVSPTGTLRCARGRRCLSPRGHSPAGPGCWAGGCGPVDLRPTGASHPWPLASRSGPAARVLFLVRPLRGRPRAGTAGAVCPFGSRAAAALPCVPACRPSRADGGDTGFESRNRCYLLIYSMETMFLCIGRTRRAHGRAWATFPTRQAGMWANDATGRPGALSPALPVSALRVTARPMGMGDAGGVGVCLILCVRPALSLRTQERRGGKSGIEPFIAKWPMILPIR